MDFIQAEIALFKNISIIAGETKAVGGLSND